MAWILPAVLFSGCGGDRGPERVVVSGAVTYQGKPVSRGEIHFTPTKGSTGPISMAEIVDGQYRAAAQGGVPVGTQQVQILAYRLDPRYRESDPCPPGKAPGDWPPKQQYLPTKYNGQSELEITVEPGSGKIVRDFALTN